MVVMEIRNVVDEVKNEYPKMTQISKKKLKNRIPNKWVKMGLSSLGITMIMKNSVLAVSPADINTINISRRSPYTYTIICKNF